MARPTLTNPRHAVSDKRYSMKMPGGSGDNITVPTSFSPSNSDWTVVMNVKVLDFPPQPASGAEPGRPDNIAFYAQQDGTGIGRTWLGIRYNLANGLCRLNSNLNNTFRNASVGINFNEWTNVALTYNLATQTLRFYKFGVLVGTFTSVAPEAASGNHVIGSHKLGLINQTIGFIGDTRLWNTTLTADEIKALWVNNEVPQQDNLVYELIPTYGEGSTLEDSSGNDLDATINGNVVWDRDRPSGLREPSVNSDFSLNFNGVDGMAYTENFYGTTGDEPFTFGAWCKIEYQEREKIFFLLGFDPDSEDQPNTPTIVPTDVVDDEGGSILGNIQTGRWALRMTSEGGDPSPKPDILNVGQWFHIAGTYDGSVRRNYINGRLIVDNIDPRSMSIENGRFQLMGVVVGEFFSSFTNGKMLRPFLFERALTSEEIFQIYQTNDFPTDNCFDIWNTQEGSGDETIGQLGSKIFFEGGVTWSEDTPGVKRTAAGTRSAV